MLRTLALSLVLVTSSALTAAAESTVTLRGSRLSMVRQNEIAKESDYSFLRTAAQVRNFVEKGYLVPLEGNANYTITSGVSFPVARPELRTFIERLSAQHREACSEKLVVTSLTRPLAGQPSNASALSVHPAGMAVDFRIHANETCRSWLENTLLSLEEKSLLDVTRERNPPHYHVAVFPGVYRSYVDALLADSLRAAEAETRAVEARLAAAAVRPAPVAAPLHHAALLPQADEAGEADSADAFTLLAVVLTAMGIGLGALRRRWQENRAAKALD